MAKIDGMDPKLVRELLSEVQQAARQMDTIEARVAQLTRTAGVSVHVTHRPSQVADACSDMVKDVTRRLVLLEKKEKQQGSGKVPTANGTSFTPERDITVPADDPPAKPGTPDGKDGKDGDAKTDHKADQKPDKPDHKGDHKAHEKTPDTKTDEHRSGEHKAGEHRSGEHKSGEHRSGDTSGRKVEVTPDSRPDAKSDTRGDGGPEAKTDGKPETRPAARPEAKPEAVGEGGPQDSTAQPKEKAGHAAKDVPASPSGRDAGDSGASGQGDGSPRAHSAADGLTRVDGGGEARGVTEGKSTHGTHGTVEGSVAQMPPAHVHGTPPEVVDTSGGAGSGAATGAHAGSGAATGAHAGAAAGAGAGAATGVAAPDGAGSGSVAGTAPGTANPEGAAAGTGCCCAEGAACCHTQPAGNGQGVGQAQPAGQPHGGQVQGAGHGVPVGDGQSAGQAQPAGQAHGGQQPPAGSQDQNPGQGTPDKGPANPDNSKAAGEQPTTSRNDTQFVDTPRKDHPDDIDPAGRHVVVVDGVKVVSTPLNQPSAEHIQWLKEHMRDVPPLETPNVDVRVVSGAHPDGPPGLIPPAEPTNPAAQQPPKPGLAPGDPEGAYVGTAADDLSGDPYAGGDTKAAQETPGSQGTTTASKAGHAYAADAVPAAPVAPGSSGAVPAAPTVTAPAQPGDVLSHPARHSGDDAVPRTLPDRHREIEPLDMPDVRAGEGERGTGDRVASRVQPDGAAGRVEVVEIITPDQEK